jgi:polyribonucleotide nucleotidyltransferase
VQVVITTLSVDNENDVDIPGLIGASAALCISDIPFDGPLGGVKIGLIDGDVVINPTLQQVEEGQLELVVAGSKDGVLMIEAGASQVPEEEMAQYIEMAHRVIQPILDLQLQLQQKCGKAKGSMIIREVPESVKSAIESQFGDRLKEAVSTPMKGERNESLDALRAEVKSTLAEQLGDEAGSIGEAIEYLAKKYTRQLILGEGKRPDGRTAGQLRNLQAHVSLLPRTHGTGMFQRGETQVLTIATLGSPGEDKIIDGLKDEEKKRYLHH